MLFKTGESSGSCCTNSGLLPYLQRWEVSEHRKDTKGTLKPDL